MCKGNCEGKVCNACGKFDGTFTDEELEEIAEREKQQAANVLLKNRERFRDAVRAVRMYIPVYIKDEKDQELALIKIQEIVDLSEFKGDLSFKDIFVRNR